MCQDTGQGRRAVSDDSHSTFITHFLSFFSLNIILKRQEPRRVDVVFCYLQLVTFLHVKNCSPLPPVIDHKISQHKQNTQNEGPSLANEGLSIERGVGDNLGQSPMQSRNLFSSIFEEISSSVVRKLCCTLESPGEFLKTPMLESPQIN